MKEKSLGGNMFLNFVRTFLTVVFPLITFPYVSRILQVENLGKISFATSVVSYFSLIAVLGVNSYAIRECAIVRDNAGKRGKLIDEVFSINVVSTAVAYILLFLALFFLPKLYEYRLLILLYSSVLVFTTIGVGWLYSAFEDFFYITIRSVLFQLISLFLIFWWIRDEEGYYWYIVILVVQSVGANILNFIHSRKIHKLKLTRHLNLKVHLKPILTLFATEIATTIYVSSDTTVLGFMTGDYYVGIYAVSSKIYFVVKQILAAILQVGVPKLSHFYNNERLNDFKNIALEIGNILIVILFPAVTGLFLCSNEIVYVISGKAYLRAASSLKILCVAMIFAIVAWYLSQCILIPTKQERIIMKTTMISAGLNLILNILMIPYWKENAAAFTTLLSEALNALVYLKYSQQYLDKGKLCECFVQTMIGCLAIGIFICAIKEIALSPTPLLVVAVCGSILIYGSVMILFRNTVVIRTLRYVTKKKSG